MIYVQLSFEISFYAAYANINEVRMSCAILTCACYQFVNRHYETEVRFVYDVDLGSMFVL
jgi:hypothetical protein